MPSVYRSAAAVVALSLATTVVAAEVAAVRDETLRDVARLTRRSPLTNGPLRLDSYDADVAGEPSGPPFPPEACHREAGREL
ncbi:MAG: hypothetical protein AAGJ97_13690, partial [Planctomycetota bacterium]